MKKFYYSKGEIVKGEKLKSENALADSSLLEKEIYGEKLTKNIVSYVQEKVYYVRIDVEHGKESSKLKSF